MCLRKYRALCRAQQNLAFCARAASEKGETIGRRALLPRSGSKANLTAPKSNFRSESGHARIAKNISVFQNFLLPPEANHLYIVSHPVPPRGALAIVVERWNGERWTLTAPLTKAPDADGEVVWS